MTRDVQTCSEADTIESLMGRMTTGKFRHMPVVEQGKLIGIVSIGDVVKSRVEEIEHDAAALRDYIQQQLDPRSAGELCAEVGDGMKG